MMQVFKVWSYPVYAAGLGCWVGDRSSPKLRKLFVPEGASDATIERRARALFEFTGRRTLRESDGCITRWIDPRNEVLVELQCMRVKL